MNSTTTFQADCAPNFCVPFQTTCSLKYSNMAWALEEAYFGYPLQGEEFQV